MKKQTHISKKIEKAFEHLLNYCDYNSAKKPTCCSKCGFVGIGPEICHFIYDLQNTDNKDEIIKKLSKYITEDIK